MTKAFKGGKLIPTLIKHGHVSSGLVDLEQLMYERLEVKPAESGSGLHGC